MKIFLRPAGFAIRWKNHPDLQSGEKISKGDRKGAPLQIVFRSSDDFILQRFYQVVEVVAVACHADNQVAVLFRVFFCVAQRIGRHHVELYMMPVHAEIGTD